MPPDKANAEEREATRPLPAIGETQFKSKNMKREFKKAQQIYERICALYLKLGLDAGEAFFDMYHDHLLCQRDGAGSELDEMEEYMEKDNSRAFKMCMDNLVATEKYCKAVIKLQEQTRKLPESIYG